MIPVSATVMVNCPVFGQSIIVALSGDVFCECFNLYCIFLVYLAGMKKSGNYCMCSFGVLITNGKEYQLTEQTVLSHCTSRTV